MNPRIERALREARQIAEVKALDWGRTVGNLETQLGQARAALAEARDTVKDIDEALSGGA